MKSASKIKSSSAIPLRDIPYDAKIANKFNPFLSSHYPGEAVNVPSDVAAPPTLIRVMANVEKDLAVANEEVSRLEGALATILHVHPEATNRGHAVEPCPELVKNAMNLRDQVIRLIERIQSIRSRLALGGAD